MAARGPISPHKLFEYVIAAILRAAGYVAGVPTSRIGGRGTTHQIDVIGIEFTHLPFLYDTVLLVEAKCYDPNESVGIDVVRQLKSNIIDLDQTLPNQLKILSRNLNPLHYFTQVFGHRMRITVCYRGAIFTTGYYSKYAKEFAFAHGIYLFNFPTDIAGRKVVGWVENLRDILIELTDYPTEILTYVPRLRNKAYWTEYFGQILSKMRENYADLEPTERHYLFTIIRGILKKHENLRPFWRETSKICLADLNGYPVVSYLSERRSVYDARKVLKHYVVGIEKRKRGRIYGSRAKISGLRLVQESTRALGEDLHEVTFLILDNSEPVLTGRLYLQDFLFKFFEKNSVALTLSIAEGLNLVAYTKS